MIQVYEIYKVIRRDVREDRAIESIAALRATMIEPLADSLALEAADISLENGLAMADAIIFLPPRHVTTLRLWLVMLIFGICSA